MENLGGVTKLSAISEPDFSDWANCAPALHKCNRQVFTIRSSFSSFTWWLLRSCQKETGDSRLTVLWGAVPRRNSDLAVLRRHFLHFIE
jgi:hypothetical protein